MGSLGMPYGFQALLKDGYKHFSQSVQINIDACKELAKMTRTSMGPDGMNKMVINHLEKLFVTSDASTIVSETDVFHPAAKLLVMAAKALEEEVGDGTNMVLAVSGELLSRAEGLLQEGLHVSEIIQGYEDAMNKALEVLDTLVLPDSKECDVRNQEQVAKRLFGAISSKMRGMEDELCPLVAEACVRVCPKNPHNFNVDNVRVVKIEGGSLSDSMVVQGMVIKRDVEGCVRTVKDTRVAVFAHGVDTSGTETKGTVLLRSAAELEGYAAGEENALEAKIKALADMGVGLIVSGSSVGDMAQHFCDKHNICVIKILSTFELRRFCRSTGSTALAQFRTPNPQDLGHVSELTTDELGSQTVCILNQDTSSGGIASIVLRGATGNMLDEVERSVDDGVNVYRAMCKDCKMTAGGGATEIALARKVCEYASQQTGLKQYPIQEYGRALEIVPRMLAENAGKDAQTSLDALNNAHAAGQANAGLDLDTGEAKDLTVGGGGVRDLYMAKWWALKLAGQAVLTILRVDQIIMAKQAGGPKPKQGGDWDQD